MNATSRRGLTLVEILVAFVILVLAITPLIRLQGVSNLQKNISIHEINNTNLALQIIDNALAMDRDSLAEVIEALKVCESETDEASGQEMFDFEGLPPAMRNRLLYNPIGPATSVLLSLQPALDAGGLVIERGFNIMVTIRWREVRSTHDVKLARFFYVRER